MKKMTTLVLSLGMLASTSVISYGELTLETKNKVHLSSINRDSIHFSYILTIEVKWL